MFATKLILIWLYQLCPTEMAYWAKNYVIISTRAAHWKTY